MEKTRKRIYLKVFAFLIPLSFAVLGASFSLNSTSNVVYAETDTEYNVWVGSTQVTSGNADGVTGDGITGTVTYDHATATLTLNNATITSQSVNEIHERKYGVYVDEYDDLGVEGFNIELIGSNSIVLADVDYNQYGICVEDSENNHLLNFKGQSLSDSLTISVPGTSEKMLTGIFLEDGNININDCSLDITTGNVINNGYAKNYAIGFNANGIITTTDADVNVESGEVSLRTLRASLMIVNSTFTSMNQSEGGKTVTDNDCFSGMDFENFVIKAGFLLELP